MTASSCIETPPSKRSNPDPSRFPPLPPVCAASLSAVWRAVLLALVVACGPASEEATTTTTEAQTTTTANRTTTTKRNTTTTAPMEGFSDLPLEQQREFIAIAFAGARDTFAEEVALNSEVRSVDKIDYVNDTVIVAVSTDYRTAEYNQDVAWGLTTDLRYLWGEEGPFSQVSFPVGFRLSVADQIFRCPGEFMLALADFRADRTDWHTACS